MRAVNGPGEALPLRGRKHFVFLIVVEILIRKAGLLLAERRHHLGFAVRLKRAHVVLGAGDQGDMLDVLAFDRMQQIAHHARIHAAVLGLRGLAQPCGDEDIRDIRVLQRRLHVLAGLQVDGNVLHAFWQVVLVARNTGDRPALGRHQMPRQMAADNAGNAGDQCVAIH